MPSLSTVKLPEGKAPPYSPMASPLREGVTDLQGVSWANYGGRTGIWRLGQIFKDFGTDLRRLYALGGFATNHGREPKTPEVAPASRASLPDVVRNAPFSEASATFPRPTPQRSKKCRRVTAKSPLIGGAVDSMVSVILG